MKYLAIILITVVLIGCKKNTEPNQIINNVYLTSGNSTISVGDQCEIIMEIQSIPEPVFGMSLQLEYNNSILYYDDSLGLSVGDFFGQNAVSFVKEENSKIYLTFTKIQGESPTSGSGKVCTLKFSAITPGSTLIQFSQNEIYYYDSEGEIIPMLNLNYEDLKIIVQ